MTRLEFENAVHDAIDILPGWVHDALDNIIVQVHDHADEDLDPDGDDLLGLYVGTPLPDRGTDYAGELPDVIYMFYRPHVELNLEGEDLREEIAKTLIHEVAHYFGIEEDRLHELGYG